jgi:hypothetical protein
LPCAGHSAVLDFFGTFFIKKKSTEQTHEMMHPVNFYQPRLIRVVLACAMDEAGGEQKEKEKEKEKEKD